MFEMIIGLEVHIQLNTKSKMFCSCPVDFGAKENSNTCPVCLALPGALPVLNKAAVKKAVSFAKAIDAKLNIDSYFDRKHYFYPDSPKGYQTSQFYIPIVGEGHLNIDLSDGSTKRVGITRAHLEEDAGKNIHESDMSKVDLNRAGTPLLEIVSEPDIRSAEEAVAYLKKLHSIVRYLDISDANMQEGSFRCDVNISIRPKGETKLYTRAELKNINSFKFITKAIEYEFNRHIDAWEDGNYEKVIVQETRLYDSSKNETRSMRSKEEALDYMYFNEPDLLKVHVDEEMLKEASKIPELPDEKVNRYVSDYGIKRDDAVVLTSEVELSRFFETMVSMGITPKNAVIWLNVELLGRLKNGVTVETSPVSAEVLANLVKKIEDNTISAKSAKDILDYLFENGTKEDIDEIISKKGLKQVSDTGAIEKMIDEILANNEDKVAEYKSGKDKLFGFFVGQVLKNNKGVNPQLVNQMLKERLG